MSDAYQNVSNDGLNSFVGQQRLTNILKIAVVSSQQREGVLSHILLTGPRGSGKSTLAKAVAYELGVNIKTISFNSIRSASDLAAILTSVGDREVILAESFDSIKQDCIEVLVTAMESFCINIVIGKGAGARSVCIDLPRFTLIATMDTQKTLPNKLVTCFPIIWQMEDYSANDLKKLAKRYVHLLNVEITDEAAEEIAKHSQGSYRQLTNMMKRARDFAIVKGNGKITTDILPYITGMDLND